MEAFRAERISSPLFSFPARIGCLSWSTTFRAVRGPKSAVCTANQKYFDSVLALTLSGDYSRYRLIMLQMQAINRFMIC